MPSLKDVKLQIAGVKKNEANHPRNGNGRFCRLTWCAAAY